MLIFSTDFFTGWCNHDNPDNRKADIFFSTDFLLDGVTMTTLTIVKQTSFFSQKLAKFWCINELRILICN